MTPFQCYKEYVALKQHFKNPKYNYFRSSGNLRLSEISFEKRNDKAFFYRLSNYKNVNSLLLSNIVLNPDIWIGSLLEKNSEMIYKDWKKRISGLEYYFKQEIKCIDNLVESIKIKDSLPEIIQLYFSKEISFETLTIISILTKSIDYWSKKSSDPILISLIEKMKKYYPFLTIDVQKYKSLIKTIINNNDKQ